MDELNNLLSHLGTLRPLQIILLLMAGAIIYIGPILIKKKYLRRNKMTVDENIEDRNAWIFFPQQYDFSEKFFMVLVYVISFLLGIVAINAM